jgi:predicted phosphodiesterase
MNRAELIALFDQSGVDLVLHGHYHNHEEYKIGNDIPVLNSGDIERYHLIKVNESGVTTSSQG